MCSERSADYPRVFHLHTTGNHSAAEADRDTDDEAISNTNGDIVCNGNGDTLCDTVTTTNSVFSADIPVLSTHTVTRPNKDKIPETNDKISNSLKDGNSLTIKSHSE